MRRTRSVRPASAALRIAGRSPPLGIRGRWSWRPRTTRAAAAPRRPPHRPPYRPPHQSPHRPPRPLRPLCPLCCLQRRCRCPRRRRHLRRIPRRACCVRRRARAVAPGSRREEGRPARGHAGRGRRRAPRGVRLQRSLAERHGSGQSPSAPTPPRTAAVPAPPSRPLAAPASRGAAAAGSVAPGRAMASLKSEGGGEPGWGQR